MDWLVDVSHLPVVAVLLRLSLAMLLGACVGWEREARGKAAGLRTHMLVSIGAAAFTLAALDMQRLVETDGDGFVDPTRILQGIVQGIGFLGAGQVIQARGSVHGVTTAAGIWVVGSVGVACGAGFYALAAIVTVFSLLVLRVVGLVERRTVRGAGNSDD